MDAVTAAWLVLVGLLVALLVRARPFPALAAVAVALLVGWPLAERGFWGKAAVALAAAGAAAFAGRGERAISSSWTSSG